MDLNVTSYSGWFLFSLASPLISVSVCLCKKYRQQQKIIDQYKKEINYLQHRVDYLENEILLLMNDKNRYTWSESNEQNRLHFLVSNIFI